MSALGQPRQMSFGEACLNTAVGYFINLVGQIVIFPLFGIHIGLAANMGIGAAFTGISVGRGYAIRRMFNWWHHRGA